MTTPQKRPEMKIANVKVSDQDMMYFSLGIDIEDFELPSSRKDYRSDARAVALVQAIKAGKNLTGENFAGINLKGADISGGNFEGADFSGAIFYKTTAKNCSFAGADFTEAYLEDTNFDGSDFTEVSLKRVYARNLNLDNVQMDESDRKKLDAFEFLIQQIESGQIDIRCLSKADLLGLDLRRLDLSKVDLEGIDLSGFILEGVNLRGVYIDPKQLMSLEGLQHYHKFVENLSEKKIKLETLKFAQSHQQEMKLYAQKQMEDIDKTVYTPKEQLVRPNFKDDKIPEQKISITAPKADSGLEKNEAVIDPTFHRIGGKTKMSIKSKMKNRT